MSFLGRSVLSSAVVLIAFGFLGCTSSAPRAPQSEPALSWQQRQDVTYQQILNSPNPAKDFADLFTRLAKINARSIGFVQEFDKQLAEDYKKFKANPQAVPDPKSVLDMFNSDVYLKIHAAEEIARRTEDTVMYLYDRLYQDAQKALAEGRKDDYRRVNDIRTGVMGKLQERTKTSDIFALESTLNSIRDYLVVQAANAPVQQISAGRNEVQRFDRQFGAQFLDSSMKIQKVLKKFGPELDQKIEESAQDQALDFEIEREGDVIKRDVAALSFDFDRKPAGTKVIFPAANAAGNIVGGSFPAGTWVLTYDDGPHGAHSKSIMQTLQRNGYRATFFWLGKNVANPNMKPIIDYANKQGHLLANHSQTHINFGAVRDWDMDQAIKSEILQPDQIMARAFGYRPQFYRCPYGACTRVMPVRQALADRGYLHAFWAVDSLDWNKAANPNGARDIVRRVQQQMEMRGRGVILFHDIHPQSVTATEMLMPYFKKMESRGGRVVSLCEAVDLANGDAARTFCRR
jgi:peptidoglycan/xylan/chitin deacetylase (PgdA/CDA1 family)